jgi:hypothetical protein
LVGFGEFLPDRRLQIAVVARQAPRAVIRPSFLRTR